MAAHNYLDRVKWRVDLGPATDLAPPGWSNPANWIWGGYGYAFPGKTIGAATTGTGVRVEWNPTPDQAPDGTQFAGTVVGPAYVKAGKRYQVSISVVVKSGSARVRATVGWNSSGAWSQLFDDVTTLTVDWTPHEDRDWVVGLESEGRPNWPNSAAPGEVTVVALSIREMAHDITDAVLDGVRIAYGRPAWLEDTDPPTLSMTVDPERLPPGVWPMALEQTITVSALVDYSAGDPAPGGTALPYAQMRRFTGRITGLSYRPYLFDVTAAGSLERLTRQRLGDSDLPEQDEVARLSGLLTAAGVPSYVDGLPRFTFTARPTKPETGNSLVNDYAAQSGAFITETRDGVVVVFTASRLDVNSGVVGVNRYLVPIEPFAATIDAGSITNRVTVTYGSDNSAGGVTLNPGNVTFGTLSGTAPTASLSGNPTWGSPVPAVSVSGGSYSLTGQSYTAPSLSSSGGGGGKPQVGFQRDASIQTYGIHDASMDTELANTTDAEALATRVLDVRATPSWEVYALELDAHLADKDDPTTRELMDLSAGQQLLLQRPPEWAPIPESYRAVVLGWTETLGTHEWTITYHLGRWATASMGTVTWQEVPVAVTWRPQYVSWRSVTRVDNLTQA